MGIAQLRPAQVTSLSLTACGEVAAGLRVEVGPLADCRSEHREALLIPCSLHLWGNLSFKSFYLLFKKTFHFVFNLAKDNSHVIVSAGQQGNSSQSIVKVYTNRILSRDRCVHALSVCVRYLCVLTFDVLAIFSLPEVLMLCPYSDSLVSQQCLSVVSLLLVFNTSMIFLSVFCISGSVSAVLFLHVESLLPSHAWCSLVSQ